MVDLGRIREWLSSLEAAPIDWQTMARSAGDSLVMDWGCSGAEGASF